MQIPLIPITSDSEKNLLTGQLSFDGVDPRILDDIRDYRDVISSVVSKFTERRPVLLMDVKGIRRGSINEVLLKHLKVRGADVWYMTCIESADDVFDAFNTDAEVVFAPYHLIRSDDDLADITGVSDCIVPTVFIRGRRAQCRNGDAGIGDVIDELSELGYAKICIFDTDGSLDESDWSSIMDDNIIPFSRRLPQDVFEGYDSITDLL